MSKKFNKFVATAAGAVVVVSAVAPAAGAAWTNSPDWMKGSLNDLVNYGVIDANSTLDATGEVTRGEVALYFARALKLDMENVQNPGFHDVPTSHKYYNAIAALATADKMHGSDKGFEPDRVINRAEMASLLVKAFGYQYGNGNSLKFTDLKGSEWAKNAIAALVDANIVSGVNVAQTLFAPTAKLTRQDTAAFLHKTMVAQGIDFAVQAKEVDAVVAVTKTGVDVVFPKVTEAREDVTIKVVNPSGKEVAVKPVNLEIGDTEITFTFEKALDEIELGTWVVGGVDFDTAAVAAVEKVLEASNQVELFEALSSKYFDDVDSDNIVDYQNALADADDEDKNTVNKIQKIIDAVNNDIVTLADKEDAVKAVKDAKNQLQLLKALKEFNRVNSEWITGYEAKLPALDADVEKAYDQIQTSIDSINTAKVNEAIASALAGLDAEKVDEATELVRDFIKADDVEKKETAKADLLQSLEKHEALINITAANTNAKLQNAFNAYFEADEDFNKELVNNTLLKEYRTAITNAAVASKNTIAEIEAIMDSVHNTAIENAVAALNGLATDASGAKVKEALQKLADVSKTTATDFDMGTVIDDSLELYRDAFIGKVTTQADVETVVASVNDPVSDLDALRDTTTTDAAALLDLLKAPALTLTNLKDANKAAYLSELATIKAEITAGTSLVADLADVKNVIEAINARVNINGTTTASNAKEALDAFAVAENVTAYINLSSTAKLEVAELVLNEKPANGFATVSALGTEIGDQITARAAILTAINTTAGIKATIAQMDTALETVEYDAYNKDLTAVQQVAVAESFLNNFPTKMIDNKEVQVDYTTLTAIKSDIDKAISQAK